MNFTTAAELIDLDIYQRFKQAIELGKWPDGRSLTIKQKELCLQTVMLYEAKNQVAESQRVGYIDNLRKKSSPCATENPGSASDAAVVRILH